MTKWEPRSQKSQKNAFIDMPRTNDLTVTDSLLKVSFHYLDSIITDIVQKEALNDFSYHILDWKSHSFFFVDAFAKHI